MAELPLKLVVTGCARSGTAYAADLLSACGLPTSHEAVFGPYGPSRTGTPALGESSWMSAPYLSMLGRHTLVIHQVRNVEDVVRSAVAKGMFLDEDRRALVPRQVRQLSGRFRGTARGGRAFREFLRMHVPEVFETSGSQWDRAIQYWRRWNALVEERCALAGLERRLLRLEDYDVETLLEIADRVNRPVSAKAAGAAVKRVSRSTNAGKPGPGAFNPPLELTDDVREMAHRYGVLSRPRQS